MSTIRQLNQDVICQVTDQTCASIPHSDDEDDIFASFISQFTCLTQSNLPWHGSQTQLFSPLSLSLAPRAFRSISQDIFLWSCYLVFRSALPLAPCGPFVTFHTINYRFNLIARLQLFFYCCCYCFCSSKTIRNLTQKKKVSSQKLASCRLLTALIERWKFVPPSPRVLIKNNHNLLHDIHERNDFTEIYIRIFAHPKFPRSSWGEWGRK